jgi:hypothetical protein
MPKRLDVGICLGECGLRDLVLGVEAEFARIKSGYLRLECGELALRGGRSSSRILTLRGSPLDLNGASLAPRAGGCDATGKSREVLPAIGLGANALGNTALLVGERALGAGPGPHGIGERRSVGLHLATQGELLFPQPGRLRFERFRIAAALDRILNLGPDQAQALGRE